MTPQARIFVAGLGLILLLVVLRSQRKSRIQFEYSALWIGLGVVIVAAAVFQKSADRLAAWVGIDYPPAFFFLVLSFCLLIILFQLSVRVSTLSDRLRRVAQEKALLDVGMGPRDGPEPPNRPSDFDGRDSGGTSGAGRSRPDAPAGTSGTSGPGGRIGSDSRSTPNSTSDGEQR